MRPLLLVLVLVGCGKQLNAEYCAQKENAMDPDCVNTGLTSTDAPAPCSSDQMCTLEGMTVCDTGKGECVKCTPSDFAACTGTSTPRCGTDDQCHECLKDADCMGGGICLPDMTCVSSDSFLYATPNGLGDCSKLNPCTLRSAIGRLDLTHRAIAVGVGDYQEGPLTIAKDAVLIGQGANGDPTATTITNAAGQQGSVITVPSASVALDYVSVYGSPGDDGVTCTGGSATFHHSNSHDNGNYGLQASNGCVLSIDRATIFKNREAGLFVTSAHIEAYNNFIYDNGDGNMNGGAVRIGNGATGDFQYNSVSFNHFKTSNTDGGFSCNSQGTVDAEFNIIAGNDGKQAYTPGGCKFLYNYAAQNADKVHYANVTPGSYDLHLTPTTPTQTIDPKTPIRDNSNTTCVMNNLNLDIDGNGRPVSTFCDLGADEYMP